MHDYENLLDKKWEPSRKHPRMPRAARAKQFKAFEAVRGHMDAMRAMERVEVPKIDLSEDMAEILNWRIREVCAGDMITVTHYDNGDYIQTAGMVSQVDFSGKFLRVVSCKIFFADIFDLRIDGKGNAGH